MLVNTVNKEKQFIDEVVLPELDGINTRQGLQRAMNQQSLYLKILQKTYSSKVHFLDEINELISENDWEAVMHLSHNLKGVAATIGAAELEKTCRAVEEQAHNNGLEDTAYQAMATEYNRVMTSLKDL